MNKSRAQQEQELIDKYLNQVVSFKLPKTTVIGKINRISFWPEHGEELVTIEVMNKQFKSDLEYFEENCIIL